MKSDKLFAQFCRLVEYGDKISKGHKTGANVSIGKGGASLTNDMHSVIVLIEGNEFDEEVAFKSHLFPEAQPPLGITQSGQDVDFRWRERGIKKSTNIPSVGNLFEQAKKVMDKKWDISQSFTLKVADFRAIVGDIHVLKIHRGEKSIIFEQMKTTGEEIMRCEIDIKGGGSGLLASAFDDDIEESDTVTSTIEFLELPTLTDDNVIEMSVNSESGMISARIGMGSTSAKVLLSPMKYKR